MGLPMFGNPNGPGKYTIGHPDWVESQKQIYSQPIPYSKPNTVEVRPEPRGRSRSSVGDTLGALLAIGLLFLAFVAKVPIGVLVLLLVGLGVAWAMRRILLKILGAGMFLFVIYLLLTHAK